MNKIIIICVIAVVLFASWYYLRNPLGSKAIINGHTINIEIAVTPEEKQKGLGSRESLASNSGMLFVYQNRDRHGFWMKGMQFPLDFIWIDGNRIVDVSENIPAPKTIGDAPVELSPAVLVDKVLEVNAGTVRQFNIKIGDTVLFSD